LEFVGIVERVGIVEIVELVGLVEIVGICWTEIFYKIKNLL
jgi:hypothetical protein